MYATRQSQWGKQWMMMINSVSLSVCGGDRECELMLKKAEETAFVALLRACSKTKDPHRGTRVHADLLKRDLLEKNSRMGDALVIMYAKCGELAKAKELLDGLRVQSVISWNTLITGYVQHGQGHKALNCFKQMQHEGPSPDAVTFV
eukprot:c42512_g1_i1 orf=1-438(-)